MVTRDERCLILGRGAMGRMFEGLLRHRLHVETWDRDPDSGTETAPLENQLADAQVLILAVPAKPHDELLRRVAAALPEGLLCLTIAKGLDGEGRTPVQRMAEHLGEACDWGALYGPMIARDLSEGRPGFALGAANGDVAGERIQSLFAKTRLHVQASRDTHGAAWAAILKNVYVPLIGMAQGLGMGDNVRGYLVTAALAELARIVERMGGDAATAYSLAGLGDLVTTATSLSSHHRSLGEDMAQGDRSMLADKNGYIRSEGVHTAAMVAKHGLLPLDDYPLFALTHALFEDSSDMESRILSMLGQLE
ncbi:glycerol-3-phosphate dehydrogenase (NAD(P)+) [Natronospira proteinivora]|uniref:Glycerol-3-phosphate dehydrogenase (NAD(P)+) n=1 Tax=Natronospira proteinivora TaxID=1807133 RepID=A0ABT1GDJ3_9GAMM|nr:NAD(P)H-dependent glycerol-3-phosphate dehydrogenase [Natronospira proteinivora]MCP1728433.1 glycerol-3-phosphate dehydrogenase (NAD(P)+) [Natronospira proteinivora]